MWIKGSIMYCFTDTVFCQLSKDKFKWKGWGNINFLLLFQDCIHVVPVYGFYPGLRGQMISETYMYPMYRRRTTQTTWPQTNDRGLGNRQAIIIPSYLQSTCSCMCFWCRVSNRMAAERLSWPNCSRFARIQFARTLSRFAWTAGSMVSGWENEVYLYCLFSNCEGLGTSLKYGISNYWST